MKNKLFKIITTSLTIVTLGGVFVPSAIYANEVLQPETVVSLPSDINRDQLTTEIISDIEKEGLPEVLNERPKRQKRGAAIEQALAQALQAAGIDAGTANTVATVTVTVASWLI